MISLIKGALCEAVDSHAFSKKNHGNIIQRPLSIIILVPVFVVATPFSLVKHRNMLGHRTESIEIMLDLPYDLISCSIKKQKRFA